MNIVEMTDAVFDVSGDIIPPIYQFALWDALVHHVPVLAEDPLTGVVPLRTSASAAGMLLAKRSKLVLRLTQSLADNFNQLAGKRLEITGCTLQLGPGKLRKIQAYPTLHAHLVASDKDEVAFLQDVKARLSELGIEGKLLCGMRNTLAAADRTIHGYSLVIHDLKPDDSLRLQYAGLGAYRRYGCGIFIPYKVITDLE